MLSSNSQISPYGFYLLHEFRFNLFFFFYCQAFCVLPYFLPKAPFERTILEYVCVYAIDTRILWNDCETQPWRASVMTLQYGGDDDVFSIDFDAMVLLSLSICIYVCVCESV